MNIKELKEYIKDLPDDMEVRSYECWEISIDNFFTDDNMFYLP